MAICGIPEVTGVKTLAFYVNKNVEFHRPDISKENEIDLITHGVASLVIAHTEYPAWQRILTPSANAGNLYQDIFTFSIYGTTENEDNVLAFFQAYRQYGFITEMILIDGRSFVFPSPVFVTEEIEKAKNRRHWPIQMNYRVPTTKNKLLKLNTLLATHSYISLGGNYILGATGSIPIVSQ